MNFCRLICCLAVILAMPLAWSYECESLLTRAHKLISAHPTGVTPKELAKKLNVALVDVENAVSSLASPRFELLGDESLRGIRRSYVQDQVIIDKLEFNDDGHRLYDFRWTEEGGKDFSPKNTFYYSWAWLDLLEARVKRFNLRSNRKVTIGFDGRWYPQEIVDALSESIRMRGYDVIRIHSQGSDPANFSAISHAVRVVKPDMDITITVSHISVEQEFIPIGAKVKMLTPTGNVEMISRKMVQTEVPEAIDKLLKDNNLALKLSPNGRGTLTSMSAAEGHTQMAMVGVLAAMGYFPRLSLYEIGEKLAKTNDIDNYTRSLLERLKTVPKPFKNLRVLIDGAHTTTGRLAEMAYSALGAQVTLMNGNIFLVRGPHKANPAIRENIKEMIEKTIAGNYHFSEMPDLDGDRVVRVNNRFDGTVDIIAPDVMAGPLMGFFKNHGGYDKVGQLTFVRDCLGTQALEDEAARNGFKVRTADAGVVNLIAEETAATDNGETVVAKAEASGHVWTHFTGPIENPVVFGLLYTAMLVKGVNERYPSGRIPDNAYVKWIEDQQIPYRKSPIFYPLFHDSLIQKVADGPFNKTKWRPGTKKRIPQELIVRARHESIIKLKDVFTPEWTLATPLGVVGISKVEDKWDEAVGIFRFIRIHFTLDGRDFGVYTSRGSGNETVASGVWEVREFDTDIWEGKKLSEKEIVERYLLLGGIILETVANKKIFSLTTQKPAKNIKEVLEARRFYRRLLK